MLNNLFVGEVAQYIAINGGGFRFDSRAGKIESSTANSSQPLRRFFGAALPRRKPMEMDPATRYTLRNIAANIMKIF